MSNVNTIFITHENDESINRFKESIGCNRIDISFDGIIELFYDGDFVYGSFHTEKGFDSEFTEAGGFKLCSNVERLIRNIKDKLDWSDDSIIIFAVHWGGREEKGYRELLNKINIAISDSVEYRNIRASYWGSVSKTFRSINLELIKSEIKSYAYPDYSGLHGVLENLKIQTRLINILKEQSYKSVRDELVYEHDTVINDLNKEISNLQQALIDLKYA